MGIIYLFIHSFKYSNCIQTFLFAWNNGLISSVDLKHQCEAAFNNDEWKKK